MPDITLIAGAVSSLKNASDILKAMVGLRDGALLQEKTIELQRVLLAAQADAVSAYSDQLTLLQRIGELEKQMAQMEAWETEKQRYELKDVSGSAGSGTYAYALKPEANGSEPSHWICAACYQRHKRSILQAAEIDVGRRVFRCPNCKTAIRPGIKP
jgi:hypothetical protein